MPRRLCILVPTQRQGRDVRPCAGPSHLPELDGGSNAGGEQHHLHVQQVAAQIGRSKWRSGRSTATCDRSAMQRQPTRH